MHDWLATRIGSCSEWRGDRRRRFAEARAMGMIGGTETPTFDELWQRLEDQALRPDCSRSVRLAVYLELYSRTRG